MLDWRIGDRQAGRAQVLASSARAPGCQRLVRQTSFLLGYLLLLTLASGIGFLVGRWSTVHATMRKAIAERIAVEEWAWHRGDAELFGSGFDRDMAESQRLELQSRFERLAPADVKLELRRLWLAGPDRIGAQLVIVWPDGRSETERRDYVRRGTDWLRLR